jgi:predicted DsbA family dithiol-disulfide isomerase
MARAVVSSKVGYTKRCRERTADVAEATSLGIDGTPTFLIGKTPRAGEPMTVLGLISGARPFSAFKDEIDRLLGTSQSGPHPEAVRDR